jgi:hypothetical protein
MTGYGRKNAPKVAARFPTTKVCKDLAAAVAYILA